ncbi:MAG: DUF5074 domain-containing protein [Bacteroidota bacterium]
MRLISVAFILLIVSACKEPDVTQPIDQMKNGMLVLCEGLYQQSNASLSWVDLSDENVYNDFFTTKNGENLGDTGNDLKVYGNKIYIILAGSNTVEVLNKKTGSRIKQISMLNGSQSKTPRAIAFYNGKAFVACQDGFVDVIDTISLTIATRIQVGSNPEDLAVANNKLYVSNSGGLNFPNYDSTVSVVNLSTFTEVKKIAVGMNPGCIIEDDAGDIYVVTRGDYSAIPSRMHRINTTTDDLTQSFSFDALSISKMAGNFLVTYYNYTTQQHTIRLFDPLTEQLLADPFFSAPEVQTLYGIEYDEHRNKIFCLDALNFTNTGFVRQYSSAGVYEKSFHVGLNPNSILVYD